MKRLITLVVCLILCTMIFASPALSQTGGQLSLAGSADGSVCSIVDTAPALVQVHILVSDAAGLLAVQFAAPTPDCWEGATWLSDETTFPVNIGDTQDTVLGWSVAFGECLTETVYVGYMSYLTQGQAAPCCEYPILKATGDHYPEIDGPIVVLCDDYRVAGVPVSAVINPEPNCPCQAPVPVERSTWGGVKALYASLDGR